MHARETPWTTHPEPVGSGTLPAALAMAVVMVAATTAAAQSAGPAARAEAEEHFQTGVSLMEAENWDSALAEFQRSRELYPTRAALFNQAMCLKALHRYDEAQLLFVDYLMTYASEARPEEMTAVQEALAEIERLWARLVVTVSMPGAEVWVDEEFVGLSPLPEPVRVTPGTHLVEAVFSTNMYAGTTITVASGDRSTVALVPAAVANAAIVGGAPSARLTVTSDPPGAAVRIDGREAGVTPWTDETTPGVHRIELSLEGYRDAEREVRVTAQGEDIDVELVRWGQPDFGWFTLGLGGQLEAAMASGPDAMKGGSFGGGGLLRLLGTVLKDPVLVDLGVEVVAGRDEPGFHDFDEDGRRVRLGWDGGLTIEQSVLVGAYAGVMVPLLVRERPLLWFTSSLGLGAWIGDDEDGTGIFTLSLAAGIAYAVTDMVELRAELLAFQVRRYSFDHQTCDLAVSLCDAPPTDFTDAGELEIWAGFWSPTIAMNLRF